MEKVDRLGWAVQDNFRFGEFLFGIRYTSEAFADVVRSILSPYEVDDEVEPVLSVHVQAGSGAAGTRKLSSIYRGSMPTLRTASLTRLLRGVLWEAARADTLHRRDHAYIRASTIVVNGSAVLGPALEGQYHRKLTRELARLGAHVISGPVATIDIDGGTVVPFPPVFVPSPEHLSLVAELGSEPSRSDDPFDVTGPKSLAAVALFSEGVESELEPITRGRLVQLLARDTFNVAPLGPSLIHVLSSAVRDVAAYGVGPTKDLPGVMRTVVQRHG